MIAQNLVPSQGGQIGHVDASTSTHVLMMANETAALMTREKTYDTNLDKHPRGSTSSLTSTTAPSTSNGSLQIEKPIFDNVLHPPKGTIQKLAFNPSARVTQNYNIVEDLAQTPCAMSTLEVLQHCPSQRKTLLSSLGAVDHTNSNCITFNLDYFKMRLSHNLAFQIHTTVHGKSIHRTVIDEGSSTCVMSLSFWRDIGSLDINQSLTTLKSFDGRGFKPYGILNSFPVELGGKTMSIDIEVVDDLLDYNLILGRS